MTDLGSSAADLLYTCAGVFGLTAVSDLFLRYQTVISFIGGVLVAALGILIFQKENKLPISNASAAQLPIYFGTAFAAAITNPATVLTFFVTFAAFGIENLRPCKVYSSYLGYCWGNIGKPIALLLLCVTLLQGCGHRQKAEMAQKESGISAVTSTKTVTELEKGLPVVWYDGETGFDEFLSSGGAESLC